MKVALTDLDSMLHIVAYKQWKAGNRDNKEIVKSHIRRFISTIEKNSGCTHSLRFFQTLGHTNYRKEILPEYKSHRKSTEWVKHWKPAIVEAFDDMGAIALSTIESDDAVSIIGREIGLDDVVVISSDKDMKQMACTQYDPFNAHKGKVNDPRRWVHVTPSFADTFLWQQVLSGDSGDMPNELCGIEGVGEVIAHKNLIMNNIPYKETVQKMYSEKYGSEKGFKRANLTYKMVRILDGTEPYLNVPAKTEIDLLLKIYKPLIQEITSDISNLFKKEQTDVSTLFNK